MNACNQYGFQQQQWLAQTVRVTHVDICYCALCHGAGWRSHSDFEVPGLSEGWECLPGVLPHVSAQVFVQEGQMVFIPNIMGLWLWLWRSNPHFKLEATSFQCGRPPWNGKKWWGFACQEVQWLAVHEVGNLTSCHLSDGSSWLLVSCHDGTPVASSAHQIAFNLWKFVDWHSCFQEGKQGLASCKLHAMYKWVSKHKQHLMAV